MFAVCLLFAMRGTLCLTPVIGCAHMDHHRACRVTSVQTTTERTENKCSASVACGWCVAQTLLLTRGPTLPPWRLSALWEVSDQHFQKNSSSSPFEIHICWRFTISQLKKTCCGRSSAQEQGLKHVRISARKLLMHLD